MPITTVDELKSHLHVAISVEMATIPPYLYAVYSIVDQYSEAALLIKSIVVEEMLHAALVSNILLAVGGSPYFGPDAMPHYPMALPHHTPPLTLNLEPCTPSFVAETLMVIEQPEELGAPPEADDYETLGQFYAAVEEAITELSATYDLFGNPQLDRQIDGPMYYRPVAFDSEDSGGLILVDDVASALEALETIVHQGEGLGDHKWADESHQELTHYYKLKQIHDGVTPVGHVHSAMTNPTMDQLDPDLHPVAELFDAAYRLAYIVMGRLFDVRNDKGHQVDTLYRVMTEIMRPTGLYLMNQAGGAGPCFGIRDFRVDPKVELTQLATAALKKHPALKPVAEAILKM